MRSSQVALVKNPPANAEDIRDTGLILGSQAALSMGFSRQEY